MQPFLHICIPRFTSSPAPPPGNSYNDEERVVAAGYDNGDVKIFDLRTNRCVCVCVCVFFFARACVDMLIIDINNFCANWRFMQYIINILLAACHSM